MRGKRDSSEGKAGKERGASGAAEKGKRGSNGPGVRKYKDNATLFKII